MEERILVSSERRPDLTGFNDISRWPPKLSEGWVWFLGFDESWDLAETRAYL